MIIMGVDPGSRITGYGLIQVKNNQQYYLECGSIRTPTQSTVSLRLQHIYQELKKVVDRYQPHVAAIEQVFMHQNPNSALKLGQARGAAMVALQMSVVEYSARQVKQAIVGFGAASKEQVQHMVMRLLNINEKLQADAADALGLALCHAFQQNSVLIKNKLSSKKISSWRHYKPDKISE